LTQLYLECLGKGVTVETNEKISYEEAGQDQDKFPIDGKAEKRLPESKPE